MRPVCSVEPTRVLITVKTYPSPSRSHREISCTAGITEDGKWVRLYPIDYRYRPKSQKFEKYQWIEVGLAPHDPAHDTRPESRRPDLESLRLLGQPLSTLDHWRERRAVVDRLPIHTKKELAQLYASDHVSLGVIRPKEVLDIKVAKNDEPWGADQQAALAQFTLFGEQTKPLEKLPYRFSYEFLCEDSSKPHVATITDWELGQLFRNVRDSHQSEERAIQDVKKKYLDQMCSDKIDTRFFMGTIAHTPTWICIGVFWPPKPPIKPQAAFDFS